MSVSPPITDSEGEINFPRIRLADCFSFIWEGPLEPNLKVCVKTCCSASPLWLFLPQWICWVETPISGSIVLARWKAEHSQLCGENCGLLPAAAPSDSPTLGLPASLSKNRTLWKPIDDTLAHNSQYRSPFNKRFDLFTCHLYVSHFLYTNTPCVSKGSGVDGSLITTVQPYQYHGIRHHHKTK